MHAVSDRTLRRCNGLIGEMPRFRNVRDDDGWAGISQYIHEDPFGIYIATAVRSRAGY
jgi:hypothetical protein